MVRKPPVGTDLKLDRTACIAMFTLTVLCGTVAATTPATTVAETTPAATMATAMTVTTDPPASDPSTLPTTTTVTTPKAATTLAGTTRVSDPVSSTTAGSTKATGTSARDDGENTSSTMNTMTGTSASGTATDHDSTVTKSTAKATGTTSKSPGGITCYKCETNDTESSCYDEQSAASQPNMTCNAGEKCWSTWYGNGETMINLTRSCHSDSCSDMHEDDDSKYCQESFEVHKCTQCCGTDMCNKHVNGGNDGGNDVSGCLTTLVLSAVVTLMIIL